MKAFSPHPYLVAAARRVWQWYPEKKLVATACSIGTKQRRCAKCLKVFDRKQVHIDHIEPVGKQPRDWDEYPAFYRRLFCPASNLQALCVECHKRKSSNESKLRSKKNV